MSQVQKLHEVTSQLYELVQEEPAAEEREEIIGKVNDLLDKREVLLQDIQGPYSDEEKKFGKEIVHMDLFVQERTNALMKQVKMDIARTKKQKSSNQKYTNPYQNVSNYDGMFMDQKK